MGMTRAGGPVSNRNVSAGVLLLLFSLSLFSGCGGDAPSSGGPPGVSTGTVSGFGSVTVNGIRYDNTAVDVVIGGVHGFSVDNLAVGMRVTVNGPFDDVAKTGTAQVIRVERDILGPTDNGAVDNAANRIRVLGQAVLVDPATTLSGFDNLFALQALQPDNTVHPVLEVHGMRDGIGLLHATFVRRVADNAALADNVFLRGTIDNIAVLPVRTFRVGSQFVNYNGATLVNLPPSGRLDNGLVVDVTGTLSALGGAGTLSASRVEVDNAALGKPNDRVKGEGYVVSGTTGDFVMTTPGGNVSVRQTGGVIAVLIGTNIRVRAEGTLSGSTLLANRVTLPPRNDVVMEGVPQAAGINASLKTFILLGKTVVTDGFTQFTDNAAGQRTFGFNGVTSTGTFRVVGSFDAVSGKVFASRVVRLSTSALPLVTLQAPLSDLASDPTLPMLNTVTVLAGANTDYFNLGRIPFPAPAETNFFAAVTTGTVVKVTNGLFTAPTIVEPSAPSRMQVEIVQVND